MVEEAYPQGSVVLVPFPFTDLSGSKRRPALVVSPDGFDWENLVLCAITSRVPDDLTEREVLLKLGDMIDHPLPKRNTVKVDKLFTMHRSLIAGTFGFVREEQLHEALGRLRELFAGFSGSDSPGGGAESAAEEELQTEEVDEAVLALLHLNAFREKFGWRAWKTFDWEVMDRLYQRGLIADPNNKAKSVVLTEEGRLAAEEAFQRLFTR